MSYDLEIVRGGPGDALRTVERLDDELDAHEPAIGEVMEEVVADALEGLGYMVDDHGTYATAAFAYQSDADGDAAREVFDSALRLLGRHRYVAYDPQLEREVTWPDDVPDMVRIWQLGADALRD